MEAQSESERFEAGNISHDGLYFTPEQLSISALVDSIGSFVMVNQEMIEVDQ